MDPENSMLSEIGQRKTNAALSPLYMDSENRLVVARGVNGAWEQGKGWEWAKCMKRIKMYKLLVIK